MLTYWHEIHSTSSRIRGAQVVCTHPGIRPRRAFPKLAPLPAAGGIGYTNHFRPLALWVFMFLLTSFFATADRLMKMPTLKDCHHCKAKIGVACKKCQHCEAKQPYKTKLEDKKKKFSQDWKERQQKNCSINKVYDATNLLLHKWELLERHPILLLARRTARGFLAECFCPWQMDTDDANDALHTIKRIYESLLNVTVAAEPATRMGGTPAPHTEDSSAPKTDTPATPLNHGVLPADVAADPTSHFMSTPQDNPDSDTLITLTLTPIPPSITPPVCPTLPPPVSSSLPPPVSSSLPPPVSSSLPPVSSTLPPPVSSSLPPPVSSTLPPPVSSTLPPPVSSTLPPPVSSSLPPPVSSSLPPPVSSTLPPPVSSSLPPPVSSSLPPPVSSTLPPPVSSCLTVSSILPPPVSSYLTSSVFSRLTAPVSSTPTLSVSSSSCSLSSPLTHPVFTSSSLTHSISSSLDRPVPSVLSLAVPSKTTLVSSSTKRRQRKRKPDPSGPCGGFGGVASLLRMWSKVEELLGAERKHRNLKEADKLSVAHVLFVAH